jgi:putative tricarboxylic transport membrane protein
MLKRSSSGSKTRRRRLGKMKKVLFEKRFFQVVVVSLLAIFVFVAGVQAADWKPTKPIQYVVPFAPGGGSDMFARTMERIIRTENLSPVPIIVVNQPGGNGMIAMSSVVQQKGNTHLLMSNISLAAPLTGGKDLPTFRDMTNIANLCIDEQVIVVKTDSPLKTIEDMVAAARNKPGTLTVGGTMTAAEDHSSTRRLEKGANIKLRYVTFKSGGECVTALLGGHVDMIWGNPSEFMSQWEAKLVRPLAIAKEVRNPAFPDIPTFKEKGFNVDFKFYRGVAAPAGLPPEVVAFYENMFKKVTESKEWKENYLKKYMLSPGYMGSKEFTIFLGQEEQDYKEFLTELGLLK